MGLFPRVELKVIAWDFDGVLNPNTRAGRFLWSEQFEHDLGHPLETFRSAVFEDFLPVLVGEIDLKDRIKAWIEQTGHQGSAEAVIDYWFSRDLYLDEELLGFAEELSARGIRQVVATNNEPHRTALVEQHLGDWPRIERVFSSGHLGVAKPDPTFFDKITDDLGIKPGEAMLIDDVGANVNAAAGQGWRSFRYSPLAKDALKRNLGL